MRILGPDEHFWDIHYGKGRCFNIGGPFYSLAEAEAKIPDLMKEKMKNIDYITIRVDEKLPPLKRWTQITDGVWKEWPQGE